MVHFSSFFVHFSSNERAYSFWGQTIQVKMFHTFRHEAVMMVSFLSLVCVFVCNMLSSSEIDEIAIRLSLPWQISSIRCGCSLLFIIACWYSCCWCCCCCCHCCLVQFSSVLFYSSCRFVHSIYVSLIRYDKLSISILQTRHYIVQCLCHFVYSFSISLSLSLPNQRDCALAVYFTAGGSLCLPIGYFVYGRIWLFYSFRCVCKSIFSCE